MRKIVLLLFLVISSVFTLVILPQETSAASSVIFQDNFNTETNNSFPSKWTIANDPNNNPCDFSWKVVNGMVSIDINNEYFCTTNIVPKDEVWQTIVGDYKISADIKFVDGTDHNLAFSFIPQESSNKFYEIHFQSPGDFVLSGVPSGVYNTIINGNYPNSNTYLVEITVLENNIKVHINGNLVRDFTSNENLQQGKIALRAGTGANPNSETWFDNITITEITDDPVLEVPLLMQKDQVWSGYQYDHSNTWTTYRNATIADSGCAMTSTAMVLHYYGINTLPNGTLLDPGSLNEWLIDNNGYHRNGSLIWNAISDLSSAEKYPTIKQYNPDYEYNGLEHDNDWTGSDERIITDLENDQPVILRVNNNKHFVLATGFENDSFLINDPLYPTPKKLSDDYNDDYQSIRRYIPSNTDLSYIILAVEDYVTVTVKDDLGNEVSVQNIEQPVSITESGTNFANYPLKTVSIQKPDSGEYTIVLSTTQGKPYLLDIYSYDKESNVKIENFNGILSSNKTESITITFDKDTVENNEIVKVVTFQSTIDDVNEAITLKLINKGIGASIVSQLRSVEKDVNKRKYLAAKLRLVIIEKLLESFRGKRLLLDEKAYQILSYDIKELKKSL